MFGVGRAVAGIGSGILAVVVPMYQGEVATAETRGAMMCVVRNPPSRELGLLFM